MFQPSRWSCVFSKLRVFFKPRAIFSILLLATLSDWGVAAAIAEDGRWTVDDLILAEAVSDAAVSTDGQRIAWAVSRVETIEKEEKRVEDVWLLRLDRGEEEPTRLTRGAISVGGLRFSPDGRHLAFLSGRPFPSDRPAENEDAGPQLWVIPVDGGEAFPITDLDRSVQLFGWMGNKRLVLAVEESKSAWQIERDAAEDATEIVDDAERTPPIRLFTVDMKGDAKGKIARLTENDDWIDQLAVSPDGKKAIVTAQQSLHYAFDSKMPPRAFLVDLTNGERRPVLADTNLLPESPRWAPDGSGFYFIDSRTSHPRYRMATVSELHFHDLETGRTEQLGADWSRGLGDDYAVTADGAIAFLADGVRHRPTFLDRNGGGRTELEGRHVQNLEGVVSGGSTLFYCTSSTTSPPQCFVARRDGSNIVDEKQVTELNAGFADKPTGRVEVIRWKGARGDEIEGLLHYPLDWREGERRPLVLDIHGGPASVDRDRWDQTWSGPNILWRQRGAFVLQTNYHGSANYGLEWVESIIGHYYEYPSADLLAGVDHLIESGLVDPDRLGSSGWSNGGILTADLITRTSRFKAAVVGAADVEWISDWANVDFGATFDNLYFQATPWENPQAYIDVSPFFRLTEVTTPTIIHTGTEDRNVPPHQSWSLFRAMQYIEKAPVRLALYPGEPHGLRKVVHQRRKLEEDLAWFDHYLFGTRKELFDDRAVPDESRLAALLKRGEAARDSAGRFGVTQKGVLVPETVDLQGLNVGRFEVTRGQYAAFSGAKVPALESNLPVVGIGADKARAYAEWLSKKTGRRWRLPTLEEAEAFAGEGGNTLDHWVGYAPNPEDATRILARLEAFGGPTPLLLPVGSLSPNDKGVFDLDGNAAEWVKGTDGDVAYGASAERPAAAAKSVPPAPAYTGFRLVAD